MISRIKVGGLAQMVREGFSGNIDTSDKQMAITLHLKRMHIQEKPCIGREYVIKFESIERIL